MGVFTEGVREQIEDSRREILRLCRAVRVIAEGAEQGRRSRARALLENGAVSWVKIERAPVPDIPNSTRLEIRSLIESPSGGKYMVFLGLSSDGSRVRRIHCDCQDFGRNSSCKHVLALVGQVILDQRRDWHRLKGALKSLESDPPQEQAA